METIGTPGIILTKDDIRDITQTINPEEAQYVMDIRSTLDDAKNENKDEVIFLAKLIAFEKAFRAVDLTAKNDSYKMNITDFSWTLKNFTEEMYQIIQSIIGEVQGSAISQIELPVSDNPLELLNEIKIMLQNFSDKHNDDKEYKGAVFTVNQFLSNVHKFIYKFRIARTSDANYAEQLDNAMKEINTEVPLSIINF